MNAVRVLMHDFRLLQQTKKTHHEIKKHNNTQEKTLGCCYTFHREMGHHQTWIKLPKSGNFFLNSVPNFALHSQLNVGKKLIVHEMTAQALR